MAASADVVKPLNGSMHIMMVRFSGAQFSPRFFHKRMYHKSCIGQGLQFPSAFFLSMLLRVLVESIWLFRYELSYRKEGTHKSASQVGCIITIQKKIHVKCYSFLATLQNRRETSYFIQNTRPLYELYSASLSASLSTSEPLRGTSMP